MGMYDTIIFEKSIICKCGKKIESTQIKEFECMMDTYHVGDMIPSAPMVGLFEEWDYCSSCKTETEFYIACSYGVYLGVYTSYKEAKEAIDTFDMTKLLKFYAQRVTPSRGMFYQSDKGFMESVVRFYDSPRPKKEGKWASILTMHDFKEETPLEAIKNYLKQDELLRAIKSYGASRNSLEISYKITDKKSAYIYNKKIEEALAREFLFKLIKIDDQKDNRPSEDNILLTFKEITQEVILDKVQQWLDDKGIELDVCEYRAPPV
jgi:hypothetical protein